jgi:hypothetical protein
MIYLEKTHLGWEQIAASWKDIFVSTFPHLEKFSGSVIQYLITPTIQYMRGNKD